MYRLRTYEGHYYVARDSVRSYTGHIEHARGYLTRADAEVDRRVTEYVEGDLRSEG